MTLAGSSDGPLAAAARALAAEVQPAEARIEALSPRHRRTHDEQATADRNHAACRASRSRFVRVHAPALYEALTEGHTRRPRLDELMSRAALMCPGLVPTEAQLSEERRHAQTEKEGREIDQAILVHGFLSQQQAGTHLLASMRQPTPRALGLLDAFCRDGEINLGNVSLQRRGRVASITIANDRCLNAEDDALVDALETAVDLTLLDDRIEVGILRGGVMSHPRYAGRRVFSSGIDLKSLYAGQISFVGFLMTRELGLIEKLRRGLLVQPAEDGWAPAMPGKPWLVAVDSFAIGGGAQLLLAVDRVIACEGSYVCLPAAQEGIVPGVANLRLTRLVGARLAKQMILCGRKIGSSEAVAESLFDEVVAATEMDAAVRRNAALLFGESVRANRHMLTLAEEPLEQYREYMAEFAIVQVQRLYDRDVLTKLAAFANRRQALDFGGGDA